MRIKLSIPDKVLFEASIPIRITDLNYGNHLGNDRILTIAHEARVQWLCSLGYNEMAVEEAGLIMADAAVQFMAEGFYGDRLRVTMGVADMKTSSMDLYYRFVVGREDRFLEIARVKTGMVFYDYAAGKVRPMPEKFRRRMEDLLS